MKNATMGMEMPSNISFDVDGYSLILQNYEVNANKAKTLYKRMSNIRKLDGYEVHIMSYVKASARRGGCWRRPGGKSIGKYSWYFSPRQEEKAKKKYEEIKIDGDTKIKKST